MSDTPALDMSFKMRMLRKIVRNDSMKVDPAEIYNWRVLLLTFSVSPPHDIAAASGESG